MQVNFWPYVHLCSLVTVFAVVGVKSSFGKVLIFWPKMHLCCLVTGFAVVGLK